MILNPLKVLTPLWIEDLCNIPEGKNIVLFFDTFEAANPALSQWLFDLLNCKYGGIPSLLLVISGRSCLEANTWNHFANWTHKIPLNPFTKEEATKYLNQKNIHDDKLVESILSISGRLPIYLALLAEGQPRSFDELADPNEQIVARFLKHIEDPLKRFLVLQASLPSQLNQDIIECLLPKDEQINAKEDFEWLKKRPFVEKRGGSWSYHPIVRNIMLRYQKEISEKEWCHSHTNLVAWYQAKTQKLEVNADLNAWIKDINWCTSKAEEHFHLLCSDYKKNIPTVIRNIGNVIASSDFNKTLPFITSINQAEKVLNIQDWGVILEEGINSLILDKETGALLLFRKINESNWIKNQGSKFFLLFLQGIFEVSSNEDKAIECYLKVIEIKPDKHEALANIGWHYLLLLELKQAAFSLLKACKLDYYKSNVASMNLGHVFLLQKQFPEAIEWYKKSLPLWEDKNAFFEGLESDFIDLKMSTQGITKEYYDNLIVDLKKDVDF